MKVHGLSNQWPSREQLFSHFEDASGIRSEAPSEEKGRRIVELLRFLESIEGPDVYVGTSHSTLNFCIRDARNVHDDVASFCTAEVVGENATDWKYRIGYRQIEDDRPTNTWTHSDYHSVEDAARCIMNAMEYASVPSRRNRHHAGNVGES